MEHKCLKGVNASTFNRSIGFDNPVRGYYLLAGALGDHSRRVDINKTQGLGFQPQPTPLADGTSRSNTQLLIPTVYTTLRGIYRNKLQLADASGITMVANNEIFEGEVAIWGYPTDGSFLPFVKAFLHPMNFVSPPYLHGQEHHDVAQSQPSSSTIPVPSTSLPPIPSPPPITASYPASTPTPIPETDPEPMEHTSQLNDKHDSLEKDLKQTKLTMGSAIVKLVKKVKKLEGILKRRNEVLSDSEEEEPEAQGRKSQDDPLVSLVQGLVTPSKNYCNASGRTS
ncbi:hypothetical protein Tco_0344409 [Tanacetum coccineum]